MTTGAMPSVAQETAPPSHSSKKRRRDDNDGGISHQLTFPQTATTTTTATRSIFNERTFEANHGLFHQHISPLAARKLMPLPVSKRQRTSVEREDVDPGMMEGEAMQRSPSPASPWQRSRSLAPQQQSPTKHRPASPVRSNTAPITTTTTISTSTAAALMSRCHICSRRPSKKSDLDSFADCEGCGQRTCYVCIRECLGWAPTSLQQQPQIVSMQRESSFTMHDADQVTEDVDFGFVGEMHDSSSSKGETAGWARGGGHRKMVCSRCCIEKGADGDVVCLGCLPFVEG